MNNICFMINGNELELDVELVHFNDIPILFICRNQNNYFLALCVNDEFTEYYVVEKQLNEIWSMLKGDVDMRSSFLNVVQFWHIKTGDNIEDDQVTLKEIKEIDESVLPYVDAKYEICDDSVRKYYSQMENKLFNKEIFGLQDSSISQIEDSECIFVEYLEKIDVLLDRKDIEMIKSIRVLDYNSTNCPGTLFESNFLYEIIKNYNQFDEIVDKSAA